MKNLTLTHEEYLAHYGVKGMKWGVRKDRRNPVSTIRSAHSKAKAKETSKRSSERREIDKIRTSKKKAKYMTDDELKKSINRLNLEAQYNRLSFEVYSPGKKFVKDFLLRTGNKAADTVAREYVIKKMA